MIARDRALNTAESTPLFLSFTVDTQDPVVPQLVNPRDLEFLLTRTPLFDWDPSPITGDVFEYRLHVVVTGGNLVIGPYALDVLVSADTTQFQVTTGDPLAIVDPTTSYQWRVIGEDRALNTSSSESRAFTLLQAQVDLRLKSDSTFVGVGTVFTGDIVVEPNGQPVSTVGAFLDFNTGDLEVLNVTPGSTLEKVLPTVLFDNIAGTVDFNATTLGAPPTGDFVLAEVTFRARKPKGLEQLTTVRFSETFPRRTEAQAQQLFLTRFLSSADFTVLSPAVDLRLGLQLDGLPPKFDNFDSFAFARREIFRVPVRVEVEVEPGARGVSTVDALLDFDPQTLRVVGIAPTGDGALTLFPTPRSNNQFGTIDIAGSATGVPPTGDFVLAVVTFQTLKATQTLNVGFHEEFPRPSGAKFSGAPILKDLIGFPVEMALELRLNEFEAPFDADVTLVMRPNGNRVTAVDAFLVSTGDLVIDGLAQAAGSPFERVIRSEFDPTTGTADFSSTTFGAPPVGEFDLAVLDVTITTTGGRMDFRKVFPELGKRSDASFRGDPIPQDRLRLTGVDLVAVPPGTLPNLQRTTGDLENIPTFQWEPPVVRPAAGIKLFRVAVTGSGRDPGLSSADGVITGVQNQVVTFPLFRVAVTGSGRDAGLSSAAGIITGETNQVGTFRCFDFAGQVPCFVGGRFNIDVVTSGDFRLSSPLASGDYLITVTPVDNLDQVGVFTAFQFTVPAGALQEKAPRLLSPIGLINDATPRFGWSVATGDRVSYRLQVKSTTGPFGLDVVVRTSDPPVTEFQVIRGLPDDTYKWRVVATDVAGDAAIPATGDFEVDTTSPGRPVLVAPADNVFLNTSTPTLKWAPTTTDVFDYQLVVTRGDLAAGPFDIRVVLSGDVTQFTVPTVDALLDGRYRWRVTARDEAQNPIETVTRTFTVDTLAPGAPGLVSPSDLAFLNTRTPIFDWDAATGDVFEYVLQVTSGDIENGPYDIQKRVGRITTRFQVPVGDSLATGDPSVVYQWRVVARDRSLNTVSSETRNFTLDTIPPGAPALESPEPSESINTPIPVLDWAPSAGDVFDYVVRVTSGNINVGPFDIDVVVPASNTRFQVPGVDALAAGDPRTAYRWRVTARDRALNTAPSSVGEFTLDTIPPVAPAPVAPADDAFLNTSTPLFDWAPSPSTVDVFGYRLQVVLSGDDFNTGTLLINEVLTGDITQFKATVILADAAYRWRVIAREAAVNTAASAVRTFSVDIVAPAAPALVSPADGAFLSTNRPLFDWQTSPSADVFTYLLQVVLSGDDLRIGPYVRQVITSADKTQFQPLAALADAAYRWRVVARDRALNTSTSDVTRTFTVDTVAPAPPALVAPPDRAFLNVSRPTFDWAPSPSTGDVFDYRLLVTSGDFRAGPFALDVVTTANSTQFQATGDLADAPYRWKVIAGDQALNTDDSVVRSFKVDTIAPAAPAALIQTGDTESLKSEFQWSRVTDPAPNAPGTTGDGSGLDFYNVLITGLRTVVATADDVCPGGICRFTSPVDLPPGAYVIEVTAVDQASNEGLPATTDFTAGLRSKPQNLRVIEPVLVDPVLGGAVNKATPTFKWTRPLELPLAGFATYQKTITGDVLTTPVTLLPFTPFTGDKFSVQCFNEAGILITTGPACITALSTGDQTQLRVLRVNGAGVPDGTHLLGVRVVDVEGRPGPTAEVIFTVDTTAPGAPGLDFPATGEFINTDTPTFDWDASTGDVFGYRLQVASGDIDAVPFDINVVLTGDVTEFQVPTGDALAHAATYQWRIIARDRALNISTSDVRTFTVDIVPPNPPAALIAPVTGDFLNTSTPAFKWKAASPSDVFATGDVNDYVLQVALSGDDLRAGPYALETVVGTGDALGGEFQETGDLATGDPRVVYQWRVVARDKALNTAASQTRAFTVDTIAPVEPGVIFPATADFISTTTPAFAWGPSPSTADVFGYRLQVTSGDINTGPYDIEVVLTGDVTEFEVPTGDALAHAETYQWRVIARDRALNTSTSDVRTFTVDIVPPSPPAALISPATGDFLNIRTPFFDWTAAPPRDVFASGDELTYLLQIVVSGDDPRTGPYALERVVPGDKTEFQTTVPLTGDTFITGDRYQWRVVARDLALNTASSQTRAFTVDTIAPVAPALALPEDNAFISTATPTLDWAPSPSIGDVLGYRVQVVVSGDAFAPGKLVLDKVLTGDIITQFRVPVTGALPTGDPRVAYQWRMIVRDRASNTSDSVPRRFTVDVIPPQPPAALVSPEDGEFINTSTPTFDWGGSPSTADVFTYRLQVVVTGGNLVIGPYALDVVISGDPLATRFRSRSVLADGAYQWRVVARDRALNTAASQTKSFTFTVDTVAPEAATLQAPDPLAFINTRTPLFDWDPSPSTGDVFGYRLQVIPAGASFIGSSLVLDELLTGDITQFQVPVGKALATGDPNRVYLWRVIARDRATNTTSSLVRTFILDTIPPRAPVLVAPATGDAFNDSTPFLDWITRVRLAPGCRVDRPSDYRVQVASAGNVDTGPYAVDVVVPLSPSEFQITGDLADDVYDWRVIARDQARNTGASSVGRFTLDTTPPGAPVLVVPATGDFLNTSTPLFDWGASVGVKEYLLLVVNSGDSFAKGPLVVRAVITAPATQFQVPTGDALADGAYRWRVVARDALLNIASSDPRTFTLDTVAPAAPALTAPVKGDFLSTSTPRFDWQASATKADVVAYLLQVVVTGDDIISGDDINIGPYALDVVITGDPLATSFQVTGDLADAPYGWRVVARDRALNTASSSVRIFKLDNLQPTIPGALTEIATGDELVEVFTWLRSNDPAPQAGTGDGSGVRLYSVVITGPVDTADAVADNECDSATNLCRFVTQGELVPGTYTIRVTAVDLATNKSGVASIVGFRSGPPGVVENLTVTGDRVRPVFEDQALGATVNTGNPQFRWSPPETLPSGLTTYQVTIISGDTPVIGPAPFTGDDFTVQCFNAAGDLINEGAACATGGALAASAEIQLTAVTTVPTGTHTINVRVIEGNGRPADQAVDLVFSVDTTAPSARVLVSPAVDEFLNTTTPTFDWTGDASIAAEGVFKRVFGYRVQVVRSGDPFTLGNLVIHEVITGDITQFQVTSGDALATGDPDRTYRWRLIARDRALNTASSAVQTFTVDVIPPQPSTGLVSPKKDDLINGRTPLFRWNASPSTADVNDYVLLVTTGDIDRGPFALDVAVAGGASVSQFKTTGDLSDGRYTWRVLARDRALNTGNTADSIFRLDATAPGAPRLVSPENRALLRKESIPPDFDWRASTGDVVGYRLQVTSRDVLRPPFDVIDLVITGDNTRFKLTGDVADGLYRWRVIARDEAGNLATSRIRRFRVDVRPPGAPVLTGESPADGEFLNAGRLDAKGRVVFDWNRSTGDEFKRDVFDYLLQVVVSGDDLNTGPFVVEVPRRDPISQFPIFLADNAYRWRVIARDVALNTASSVVRTFTMDTLRPAAPVLTSLSDGVFLNTGSLTFDWDASTTPADVVEYRLLVVVSGDDIVAGPFVLDVVIPVTGDTLFPVTDDLSDRSYRWRVVAVDRALNTGASVARTFFVDTLRPPTPGALTEVTAGDELVRVFTWERSIDGRRATATTGDESGTDFYNVVISGPLNFRFRTGDTDVLCPGDICRFVTPELIPGAYTFTVNAIDRAGNRSAFDATLAFRAGPASAVADLRVVDPVFLDEITLVGTVNTPNPTFRWTRPEELPALGLADYIVAIVSDTTQILPVTSFRDSDTFSVECFNVAGDQIASGGICILALETGDEIQITVEGAALPAGVLDGSHTLQVRVVGTGDVAPRTPVVLAFVVDTTPPAPPVLVAPADGAFINTTNATFDWDASTGDVFGYRLRVTSGDIETGDVVLDLLLTGDATEFQVTGDLATGDPDIVYQWRVISRDQAVNTASSEADTFTLDTIAPAAPAALVAPEDSSFSSDTTPLFDWLASAPSTADTFDYRLVVVVSGDDFKSGPLALDVVVKTGDPLVTEFQVTGDLVDNTYRWRVEARDRALNTGASVVRSFTVDTIPPAAPALVFPVPGDLFNTGDVKFDWAASTSVDVVTYRLQVQARSGDAFNVQEPFALDVVITTGEPPLTITEFKATGDLPDTTYRWRVVAEDRALNTASSTTPDFRVDTIQPLTPESIREVTTADEQVEIFTWPGSKDPVPLTGTTGDESGVASYNVQITGPQDVDSTVLHTTCTLNSTGDLGSIGDNCRLQTPELIPGFYVIQVTPVDVAGNIGVAATADFRSGPLVVVRNLKVFNPVFVEAGGDGLRQLGGTVNLQNPDFRWSPPEPEKLLIFGTLNTYEVAITADDLPRSFTVTNFFRSECFKGTGDTLIGQGIECIEVPGTSDEIQIALQLSLPDGTHRLGVRVIAVTGDQGEIVRTGSLIRLPFTVDTTPPNVTDLSKPSPDEDDTPTLTWTTVDEHSDVVAFHRVHIESEVFIDVTVPPAPELVSPEDELFSGTADMTRTFAWAPVIDDISAGAGLTYTFELASGDQPTTGSFVNPIFFTGDVPNVPVTSGDRLVITADVPEDKFPKVFDEYFWHVRSVDRAGNIGDFSKPFSFTLGLDTEPPGKPSLIIPPLGFLADDTTPEFVWSEVTDDISGVRSFNLELRFAEDNSIVFTADDIRETRFTIPDDKALKLTGNYIWRVTAVDRARNVGPTSDPSTFSLVDDATPPASPTLVEPADGSVVADNLRPTLKWSEVTTQVRDDGTVEAEKSRIGLTYGVQLSRSSTGDFSAPLVDISGLVSTQLVLSVDLSGGTFSWRVRATDGQDNVGEFSDFVTFVIPEDTVAPSAPKPVLPATGDQVGPRATFIWTQVTDPSGVTYLLEIATGDTGDQPATGSFVTPVFTAGDIPDDAIKSGDTFVIRFTLSSGDVTTGGHVWHVRAVDGAGNTGDFSSVRPFSVTGDTTGDVTPPPAPVLVGPPDAVTTSDTTPTFAWSRVIDDLIGVERYILEIAAGDQLVTGAYVNPVFTGDIPDTGDAGVIEFTLSTADALATGDYTWHVQAVDGTGNGSRFSEPFSITIDTVAPRAPVLLAPSSGDSGDDGTPTFIWRQVTGDQTQLTYTLEIATGDQPATGSFVNPVFSTGDIADTPVTGDEILFTLPDDSALALGDHVWRVVAVDKAGNTGDSGRSPFTVVADVTPPSAPTLVSPIGGATGDDPTPIFTWTRVADPSSVTYTLEVATGDQPATGSFVNPVFSTGDIPDVVVAGTGGQVQFTLPVALATGDYIWHVRAVDRSPAVNTGDFSSTADFTVLPDTTPPGVPVLKSPATGDSFDDTTPTFVWSAVTGDISGVTYTLEISFQALNFASLVFSRNAIKDENPTTTGDIDFTLPLTDSLLPGTYIWHVRAVDGAGNTGDFSSSGDFTVVGDTTPPAAPDLIAPATGDIAVTARPTFQWTQVTDPSGVTYRLQVSRSTTGDFRSLLIDEGDIEITSFKLQTQLPGGSLSWRAVAVDGAGNTADSDFNILRVLGTPQGLTMEFPFQVGTADVAYTPTLRWQLVAPVVTGALSYEVSLDHEPFRSIGTGDLKGGDIAHTADSITFGPHHIFQVRAVTGSRFRGGIATLFFSDSVAQGGPAPTTAPLASTITVPNGDFLPLGEHIIQVSGADRLLNTGDPKDAQLSFNVFQLAMSLQPPSQTVVNPGDTASLSVRIEPRGLTVNGAEVSIDFDSRLTFAGVVAQAGATITEVRNAFDAARNVGTADFKASFGKISGTDVLDFATVQFNTPTAFTPAGTNVLLVTTGDRRTTGLLDREVVPAVLRAATVSVNAPPIADAGDPQAALVGETLTFNGGGSTDSDGTIAGFVWDFGDGATDTGLETTHVYDSAGSFTVTLTVTDDVGATATDTLTATITPSVFLNLPPTANAGPDVTAEEGVTVTLNGGSSIDPEGFALTVNWTQTIGSSVSLSAATTLTPAFVASDNGIFGFQLTVTDFGGLTATDSVVVTVTNVAPTITNVAADPSPLDEGQTASVAVSATDVPADVADFLYSFDCDGDGVREVEPQAGSSTTCSFPDGPATVTVAVQVDDQDGGISAGNVSVTVNNLVPIVTSVSADPTSGNEPLISTITVLATDVAADVTKLQYSFDCDADGNFEIGPQDTPVAVCTYPDGPAEVTTGVLVDDQDGGVASGDAAVTVDNVDPTVQPIDDQTADEGDTVDFNIEFVDVGPEDTINVTVDWGDDTDEDEVEGAVSPLTVEHVYADDGTFTVSIGVADDDEGVGSGDATVTVSDVAPVVEVGPDQTGFTEQTITVTAIFTDPGTLDTHTATIDWGDGTVEPADVDEDEGSGTVEGEHEYLIAGAFPVAISVIDDKGPVGTGSLQVLVLVSVAVLEGLEVSDFSLSTTTPVPPETVTAQFTLFNDTDIPIAPIIDLLVNGVLPPETTFTDFVLLPGEFRQLQHTITRWEPGIYAVQMFDQVLTFTIAAPAMALSNLSVTPQLAGPRGTVLISVDATNVGGVAGRFNVDLKVDGSSQVRRIRLVPGDSATVVRFVRIPRFPPSSGPSSPGDHRVRVGKLKGSYEVAEPELVTPVSTTSDVNPQTTRAATATGQPLDVIPGGQIRLGAGSITLSIPVRAPGG